MALEAAGLCNVMGCGAWRPSSSESRTPQGLTPLSVSSPLSLTTAQRY